MIDNVLERINLNEIKMIKIEISLIYNYQMKASTKTKFDMMSQCLKSFKQIPNLLHNFVGSHHNHHLVSLVQCSNRFVQLAQIQGNSQNQISLYHRFFSRIKQIMYSCFHFYMHTDHFLFIKEFLVAVNKQILSYKPDWGYSQLLANISTVIVNSGLKIAKTVPLHNEQLNQIFGQKIDNKLQKVEPEIKEYYIADKKKYTENVNPCNQSLTTSGPFTKAIRYEILQDIDPIYIQKLYANGNSDDLFKNCLNRNKLIQSLIQKYSQKHKQYISKPQLRKNRNSVDYCPTKFTIQMRKTFKKQINCRVTPSPKKTKTANIKLPHNIQPPQSPPTQQPNAPPKQQPVQTTCLYRQKYRLNKIMIGERYPQKRQPDHVIQISQGLKTNHSNTPKSNTQRQGFKNLQTRCQHIKIKTNRVYIEGVVSIPLREIN